MYFPLFWELCSVLKVFWVGLQSINVVFPDHTHLLFYWIMERKADLKNPGLEL